MSFLKWALVIGLVLLVIVGGIGYYIYTVVDGVQREGVALETELSKQYQVNQNELSAYVSGFYEQLGIADRKSDKMDKIIEDAVKGRYDGKTSAQPGQGTLFSAIVEAYPDLGGLAIYDKIVDYIQVKREAYKNAQNKLLQQLSDYSKWRNSGILRKYLIRMVGHPSDALRAQVGTSYVTGQAALDKMYIIVLTSDTIKAYETGIQDPLQIPKN